jgi:hypothetical protein
MNSASEDIKDMLLDDSSLGLVFATNLFIAKMPSTRTDCVVLVDTGGSPDVTLDNIKFYNTSLQIRVRHTSYTDGWELINNIVGSLLDRVQETWNGTLYSAIVLSSEIAPLGSDDKERHLFSVNLNLKRR